MNVSISDPERASSMGRDDQQQMNVEVMTQRAGIT